VRGALVRAALVAAWLLAVAAHLRYEAFPEWLTGEIGGYASLFGRDTLIIDSWSKILFNGSPIGYSHTSLESEETNASERYTLNNRLYLKLSIMGETHALTADTTASLNSQYQLQKFSFGLSSKIYSLSIKGQRVGGPVFDVELSTDSGSTSRRVQIPDDAIIYSPMTELALQRLRAGNQLSVKAFDPATLSTSVMVIRALRNEEITVGGRKHSCTVLATDMQGATVLSWMAADGRILRQETPFGWTMELCAPEEAFEIARKAAPSGDLLAGLAVPCEGEIRRPRSCSSLTLRLSGAAFSENDLAFPRQKTVSAGQDGAVLVVSRGHVPSSASAQSEDVNPAVKAFLAATPFIQSDHQEMRDMASEITRNCSNDIDRVLAILDWVNSNVAKEMAVSFPSALDVLRKRRGDCNEHTYLFTALARAAGIPAKVIVGLAYQDGMFYYHAWPAVYLGEWWELDPTWNQQAVDATHIAMVEGEIERQIELMRIIGRLRIAVLEEKTDD